LRERPYVILIARLSVLQAVQSSTHTAYSGRNIVSILKETGTMDSKHYVIFTDLDDTLLDSNYGYKDAEPTIRALEELSIPVVFCSAKTYAEQEVIRRRMGVEHPFIVEDGSAIYIPRGYFVEKTGDERGDYYVIVLGVEIEEIAEEIGGLSKDYHIKSYSTMSAEEVAQAMNLDVPSARMAKDRQFSETVLEMDEEGLKKLKDQFNVVRGGRAIQVYGKGADKGKAVEVLTAMYRQSGEWTTVGLGNSYNDEPMLRKVDIPVLVRNPDGSWADVTFKGLHRASEIGPKGWSESIRKFVLRGDDG
jgi:mannosyl-3-phosphoglycerate phosphatase